MIRSARHTNRPNGLRRHAAGLLTGLLCVFVWPLSTTAIAAPKGNVQATANPESVAVGGNLSITLRAQIAGNHSIQILGRPDVGEAFQIIGMTRSPSRLVRNGHTTRGLTLSFRLLAVKAGDFTIDLPEVRLGSERVHPDGLDIHVDDQSATQNSPSTHRRPRPPNPPSGSDKPVFVDHVLEPSDTPYVGEQVTLAYYLYAQAFRLQVHPQSAKEPSLDDFWIEDLSTQISRARQTRRVNGKLMERSTLRAYALFPLQAGAAHIEPLSVDLEIGGFTRRGRVETIQSDAIDLDVQPLPADAPDSFSDGNVGQWNFEATSDRTDAKMGQSVTIRVRAYGDGHLGRITLPDLPPIDGARVAGQDENVEPNVESGRVGGQKVTTYTIVPEREGRLTVPGMKFSYFDPDTERYHTDTSDPISITVKGGRVRLDQQSTPTAKPRDNAQEATVLETLVGKLADPRTHINTQPTSPTHRSDWLWFLLAIPVVGVAIIWLADPIRAAVSRRKSARRGNGYKQARAALLRTDGCPPAECLDQIRHAVTIYMTTAADVPPGGLSKSQLPDRLVDLGVSDQLAARIGALLDELDQASYSPDKSARAQRVDELRRECLDCLDALHNARRNGDWTAHNAGAVVMGLAVVLATVAGVAPPPALAGDVAQTPVQSALKAQKDARWDDAAKWWKQVADKHPHAPDVLYNLGTAAAHAGEYGPARLALERASVSAPGDADIETNRDLVHQIVRLRQIQQARGTARQNTTSEGLFWWRLATDVSAHMLMVVLVIFAWLILIASVIRARVSRDGIGDACLAAAGVCAVCLSLTAGVWVARGQVLSHVRPAVITVDEVDLREGPSQHAGLADIDTILVSGVLLPVEDTRKGWVKLAFADGSTAWTSSDNVEGVTE